MNPGNPEIMHTCGTCSLLNTRMDRWTAIKTIGAALVTASTLLASGQDSSSVEAQVIENFTRFNMHKDDFINPKLLAEIQRKFRLPTIQPEGYVSSLPKEVRGYRQNDFRGNVEFTHSLVIPKGQGFEISGWKDGSRIIHDAFIRKYQEEFQGQFNATADQLRQNPQPIIVDVDFTQVPDMGTFWGLVQRTGKLPQPTPGKKTVHFLFISIDDPTIEKSKIKTLNWGGGGFASVDAYMLLPWAYSQTIRGIVTTLHEGGHAWLGALHTNQDLLLNRNNDPNYQEVPGNLWASSLRIVDGFRTLDKWHVLPEQLELVNVGPNSVQTTLDRNGKRIYLPQVEKQGRRAFLRRLESFFDALVA